MKLTAKEGLNFRSEVQSSWYIYRSILLPCTYCKKKKKAFCNNSEVSQVVKIFI